MMLSLPALAAAFQLQQQDITFLHWNPHWQCFEGNVGCSSNATAALTSLLSDGVDFANVVELETAKYTPPLGWAAVAKFESCGRDWDTLFFNTARWRRLSKLSGCVAPADSRSFAAGVFQSTSDPALVLTVVGAHYPQTLNASSHAYEDAVGNLSASIANLYTPRAVLLADTNTEGPAAAAANESHHGVNKTNAQILSDIGLWPKGATQPEPPSSTLFKGCCLGDNFSWQGDRIIANFGTVLSSKVLFDPAPEWAVGEFHKGVELKLRV